MFRAKVFKILNHHRAWYKKYKVYPHVI